MAESEEELKSLLMKMKEESEKVDLKLNIQKTKIMTSTPISSVHFSCSVMSNFATPWITACQAFLSITNFRSSPKLMSIESVMPSSHLILCHPLLLLPPIPPSIRVFSNESTLRMRWPKSHHFMANRWGNETVTDFIFLDSKITADGDCSHEIKRPLLLGRKAMTNLDNILKSRDIILPTKAHLVKAMIFPLVLYGCESWTIKKTERQRIDAFELWCWRRFLRAPWAVRRSNQSILKEISPEYSLKDWRWSWNSNPLASWCEELTHWKRPCCWERGEGDDSRWDGWMASPIRRTWVWASSWSWWWTGRPGLLLSMGLQRVGHDWMSKLNWACQDIILKY